ncbi:HtaA domain-containing protein [Amycolatopsis sp. cmx-8-4]|uniref:HtaA domain-containing protein n=1 Tax=Amycolatopsis sp. cmx-8-4 TaxID=2790947 RepID=UPI00397D7E36
MNVERFGGTATAGRSATATPSPYRWPAGTSTFDGTTGKGSVAFGGRVTFVLEPHLIWNFELSNPKVTFAGDGTGKLTATRAVLTASIEHHVPRVHLLEHEYTRAVTEAEPAWVRAVSADLAAGTLAWDAYFVPRKERS